MSGLRLATLARPARRLRLPTTRPAGPAELTKLEVQAREVRLARGLLHPPIQGLTRPTPTSRRRSFALSGRSSRPCGNWKRRMQRRQLCGSNWRMPLMRWKARILTSCSCAEWRRAGRRLRMKARKSWRTGSSASTSSWPCCPRPTPQQCDRNSWISSKTSLWSACASWSARRPAWRSRSAANRSSCGVAWKSTAPLKGSSRPSARSATCSARPIATRVRACGRWRPDFGLARSRSPQTRNAGRRSSGSWCGCVARRTA
mmetsp:Transcript_14637/g.42666  ORF Transcript_14637/g.42666 Transcript_14637/m.42666 type:complete len:259 (-) Transcript_14637:38-814(-)